MDRRSNIVYIRNELEIYNNKVNFAIYLHEFISDNRLPPYITLRPLVPERDAVLIDFVHPNSNYEGHIAMFSPNENERGFAKMLCSVNAHNGCFIEITVNTIIEVYGVIAFCQNILQYQPDTQFLEYVRVPTHLLNHWCVTPQLRGAQDNRHEDPLDDPQVEQQNDTRVF
jgi:hypothetical protein